ncbi:MerR family transcriptional regulator [Staphylococcus pseudoxylosus]|uniref:MerR family transcriptional regulator n=1 Tax=Staphylococcus pseudoxylosus TaxID=2282419 RepID=UPI002DBB32A1|nr:MerR family transcriptional regulator [Staphylococcus pseudoxylosus]MEB6170606.1 MerR family transcriptional regulator [Staphylococcus pseudoxylosus]
MNISEAAKKTNVTTTTIRYYEKMGLIPEVKRESGNRVFTDYDLGWIEFIKCMRSAGLPIESLARYTALYFEGEETLYERRSILQNEQQKLIDKQKELKNTIERLDGKIDNYDDYISDYEQNI